MRQETKERLYRICGALNFYPHLHRPAHSYLLATRIRLRGAQYENLGKPLYSCKVACSGAGNSIFLLRGGMLQNCTITIFGDNNAITIGEDASVIGGELCLEGNNNRIIIGGKTAICGKTHLACTEGRTIRIGEDCLFSSNITVRTRDSHSILDADGRRINPAKDATLGNHVWVGNGAMILKGVSVANGSIIGAGAVVTKGSGEANVVLAGNPAKIVKRGVSWSMERISCERE